MGLLDRLKQAFGRGGPAKVRVVGGAGPVRALVEDTLEEEGWVLTAEGPVDFAVVFAAPGSVTDTSLSGDAASAARVLLVAPVQLPIEQVAELAEAVHASGWLGAPFTREELLDEIRRCVALTPHEAAEFRRGLRSDP